MLFSPHQASAGSAFLAAFHSLCSSAAEYHLPSASYRSAHFARPQFQATRTPVRPAVAHRGAFYDAVVEALAREKQDRHTSVQLLEKYLQTQDEAGMNAAFDYYMQNVLPALPYPKVEQFADAQRTTSAVNAKAADVRVESFLDSSFVQSAAERGLDKGS